MYIQLLDKPQILPEVTQPQQGILQQTQEIPQPPQGVSQPQQGILQQTQEIPQPPQGVPQPPQGLLQPISREYTAMTTEEGISMLMYIGVIIS